MTIGWLIGLGRLTAVDDPSLSQLSTAGIVFVSLLFVGLLAAVAIPTWRRSKRRREQDARLRRQAQISASPPRTGGEDERDSA